MKSRLRTSIAAAAALLIASYGLVAATQPEADAGEVAPKVAANRLTTTLPSARAADVLVDDARQRVFISLPEANSIVVSDLDGNLTHTIEGVTEPGEMALSGDGSAAYVVQQNASALSQINTETYEVTHLQMPDGICPFSLTYTGGKVWFSYGESCASETPGGNGVLDPSTGEVTASLLTGWTGEIRALPDRPDRLVVSHEQFIGVYDVSSEAPRTVAERAFDTSTRRFGCRDAALVLEAEMVVTTCRSPYERHQAFFTSNLDALQPIPSDGYPNAVAATNDGRYVAVGGESQNAAMDIKDIRLGPPGTTVKGFGFSDPEARLAANTLAFGAGRLFAVEHKADGNAVLHVYHDATRLSTSITATPSRAAIPYAGTARITGTLRGVAGPAQVNISRSDRTGEQDVGTIPVAEDGTFGFKDTPGVTGPVTYRIAYLGDEEHLPSEVTARVIVRPRPYDMNADGYAETVVSAPGEDLGAVRDAGMFHVLYGDPSGVVPARSQAIHQDTPGVPGSAETGDRFGHANTSGDFNGDGYADLAVAASSEDLVGFHQDGGAVWIFKGSADGLLTDDARIFTLSTTGNGAHQAHFGHALAAGDFHGDGYDDLAIGIPGMNQVFVLKGGALGLRTGDGTPRLISQDSKGVPGVKRKGEQFGWSLSAGDVNANGRDDLAIGAPLDRDDRDYATGSVTVVYSTANGLSTNYFTQRWSKEAMGVPGSAGAYDSGKRDAPDRFGHDVLLRDLNARGTADLAVGAPGSPVTVNGVRKRDAGTVTVLYSHGSIQTHGATQISQQTSGIPGVSGQEDHFGLTVTGGDATGDGIAELAIYSPGDTYVTVVPGSYDGLAYGSAKGWTQNSTGIPGSTEAGDKWGDNLRFADIQGTGYHALIVGAPGENSGAGAITVIYSTSTGLTGAGAKYLSQNSTGIPGTAESGDAFGTFR